MKNACPPPNTEKATPKVATFLNSPKTLKVKGGDRKATGKKR